MGHSFGENKGCFTVSQGNNITDTETKLQSNPNITKNAKKR